MTWVIIKMKYAKTKIFYFILFYFIYGLSSKYNYYIFNNIFTNNI